MPVTWNDSNRITLLLKLVEQNPSILFNNTAKNIASTWPGPEKPTERAIQEQIKTIRKQLKDGNFKATSNPRQSSSLTPQTPKTPARSTPAATAATSSTKRKQPVTTHTPNKTLSKKQKFTKKSSDQESEAPELSSSADDTGNNESTLDEAQPRSNTPIPKRTLLARPRSKSYVADADSAGEDAGAKDLLSDEDSEFSLGKEGQVKTTAEKKKGMSSLLGRKRSVADQDVLVDSDEDEDVGFMKTKDQGCDDESDVESKTTAGFSHQTYASALDDW